jgi:uncharacterized protein
MLHNKLPSIIQPERLCREAPLTGNKLTGQIMLCDLPNLSKDILSPKETLVAVNLTFSMDNEGICCIKGEMSVDVQLICQRCLKPMIYPVRAEICVSPVVSDKQAEQLSVQYEPLLTHHGEISMSEWIAEELHLALPLAPRHEPSCGGLGTRDTEQEKEEPGSGSKPNPFAKLVYIK